MCVKVNEKGEVIHGRIGKVILRYASVTSTNILAKELAKDNAHEGTVIVAVKQVGGRGRKDRVWHSPPGGLWFSMILYPDLEPGRAMLATMCASLAVVEGVKSSIGIDANIKWPNDVLINGRKVAGILTEIHSVPDELKYIVVGVGVNVNNRIPKNIEGSATSLLYETDQHTDIEKLLEDILGHMDDMYSLLIKGRHQEIRELWLARSDIKGRKVRVTDGKYTRTGMVRGIDQNGCLLLDIGDKTVTVVSGDVELL